MKKTTKLLALALALVLALGLAGCGAKTSSMTDSCYSERISSAPMEEPRPDTPMESESMPSPASAPGGFGNLAAEDGGFYEEDVRDSAADIADMSEKIIYSADATLETTEFEHSIEEIHALVKELGGFMESSTISGNNYYSISRGNTGGRYASFLIRVPSDKFSVLTGSLSEFGNVPYCNTYMQNVTMEYYDVQSRLEAYKTQETRLLEMLAVAKSVEDMLAIQQQLTDVQYEIDSLTGQLRYYDHQVNYSTVSLYVSEVTKYTPEPTITLTYWERMTRGFSESLKDVGEFFQDLFLWFVTSLPWLVPLAQRTVRSVPQSGRQSVPRKPKSARRRPRPKPPRRALLPQKKPRKTAKNNPVPFLRPGGKRRGVFPWRGRENTPKKPRSFR